MQGERARPMRPYADLHLCPDLEDLPNARSMANLLLELQISTVGLVMPPERLIHPPAVFASFKDIGVHVARRLNLKPKSREELLRSLRRFRKKFEIIAVDCDTLSVSRVAVRDRRVDMVYFPRRDRGNMFRGSLGTTCRAALEVSLPELISGPSLPTRLQSLRRDIEAATRLSIPVIGSTMASTPYQLRSPRDIAAVLHLAGLPLETAVRGVSEIPLEIVKKNRLRLEQPQLEDGVKVVRRSTQNE